MVNALSSLEEIFKALESSGCEKLKIIAQQFRVFPLACYPSLHQMLCRIKTVG